jgi:hypothetical protein
MKKKILAVLSLVMVLAMESVTVFAAETGIGTSVPSPNANTIAGSVETTTTENATIESVTIDNLDVSEITTNIEVTTTTDEKGDEIVASVDTVTKDEFVFIKEKEDEDEGLKLNAKTNGEVKTDTLRDIKLNKEQGHQSKPLTESEKKESISIAHHADSLGKEHGANLESSYIVSVEGSVDAQTGKPDKPVSFDVPNAQNIVNGNFTIIHKMENGKTENLGGTYSNGKITSNKIPSSYSPFILLIFDKPVPGLTTEIDYTTQSSAFTNGESYSTNSATNSGTIAGAVSPKTNDAYPYAVTTAVVALACGLVCTRKLAKK